MFSSILIMFYMMQEQCDLSNRVKDNLNGFKLPLGLMKREHIQSILIY